jgi:uncharacterized protein YajQ (UPF0234 family)
VPANSFDIVSNIDLQEVVNAIHQTEKEVRTRYDLKQSKSTIEFDSNARRIVVRSQDTFSLRSVLEILEQKLVRRKVPLKGLHYGDVQPGAGSSVLREISLQQGIPIEKAREMVKLIKNMKLKVQASIQGDQVRVSGKKRDELQEVIAALRERDFGIDVQFSNYRSS